MARRNKKQPLLEKVLIEDIAAEGKALARVDNKVVFTPFAIPGDVVDIQITQKRKSYMEGYVTHYHEYSPLRIDAFCEHFGMCGGCKWQSLPYAEQLKFKQRQVSDQLRRIGRAEFDEISPIIGSEKTTHYRNKLEFTFSNSRWLTKEEIASRNDISVEPALGFHIPGMFDKVFDVKNCYLQPEPSNSIRLEVRKFALQHDLTFYNIRSREGLLRNLIIRTSCTGDVMAIFSFFYDDVEKREQLLDHIKNCFPQITSLLYVINPKANDTINDLDIITFSGNDYILESMEGLKFKIGPKSFYQTNSEQAYTLYKVTREFAGLTGNELVYDLYTGTGTIAQFVANSSSKVIGIEYIPEAIEDAKVNSAINGISNVEFFAGDIKNILVDSFFQEHGFPDVVILDPPRAGIHEDVANALLQANPSRIVYVSCNPATQARDIALLSVKYKLIRVQPVDMFPHTHHVENVVLLQRMIL
ncbi:MAG: 23S rRNA (uracil(1939)-C(5))-methyltransferase RlmD [Bacteroidales bacterium]|nr:MAG: 23S rRNA (uracil(1939)-C(5))-methyltransferase RlmD [Bacteroidales bacterium]